MTRTISLIIGIVGAALLFVVPAYGDNWGADQTRPGGNPGMFQILLEKNGVVDHSVLNTGSGQPAIVSENTPESPAVRAERLRSEGMNKKYGLGEFAVSPVTTYKDANERVVEPQSVRAERLRSEGLNRMYGLGEFAPTVNYKDANERVDLPTTPEPAPVATSGRDVEWPQVGIGFGIGIALAIGLGLSLKATRPRTLAH
jgi:hypothetical protein